MESLVFSPIVFSDPDLPTSEAVGQLLTHNKSLKKLIVPPVLINSIEKALQRNNTLEELIFSTNHSLTELELLKNLLKTNYTLIRVPLEVRMCTELRRNRLMKIIRNAMIVCQVLGQPWYVALPFADALWEPGVEDLEPLLPILKKEGWMTVLDRGRQELLDRDTTSLVLDYLEP